MHAPGQPRRLPARRLIGALRRNTAGTHPGARTYVRTAECLAARCVGNMIWKEWGENGKVTCVHSLILTTTYISAYKRP